MTRVLLLPSPLLPRLSALPLLDALASRLRDVERVEASVDVAPSHAPRSTRTRCSPPSGGAWRTFDRTCS